jgi:uncharacterized protein (DUF1684 family)
VNKILGILVLCCIGCSSSSDYTDKIVQLQSAKNASFLDPEKSPLTIDEIRQFKGLNFFVPNEQFKVDAIITWLPQIGYVNISQTGGDIVEYMQTAVLNFSVEGKPFQLFAYQNEEMKRNRTLFVPFTDETNGTETYSGGRYIDLPYNDHHKEVVLDFNYSYIPYCAYTPRYSCPKVPRENHLDIAIKAGERMTN